MVSGSLIVKLIVCTSFLSMIKLGIAEIVGGSDFLYLPGSKVSSNLDLLPPSGLKSQPATSKAATTAIRGLE